jgi:hypothetical protein
LAAVQLPPAVWAGDLTPGWTGAQALTWLHRPPLGSPPAQIAEGVERREGVTAEVAGTPYRGQPRGPDPSALRQAVDTLLSRARVPGLRHVRDQERFWERPRRRDGRREATGQLEWDVQVTVSLDQEAVAAAGRQRSWRV